MVLYLTKEKSIKKKKKKTFRLRNLDPNKKEHFFKDGLKKKNCC